MGTHRATASERITAEVTAWPGVHAEYGTRGEFAFKLGGRELGHLHGDHVAHFGFPKHVWTELPSSSSGSTITRSSRAGPASARGGSRARTTSAT